MNYPKAVSMPCPQCGSEVENHHYTYLLECDHCLSKKEE
ncbi:YhfH family protein [Halobacillus litoralis]|uniref:YhfH family protein n=1 Tax=Halobacillus litoralis TaxID=45668 RepID=A0A845DTW0_9BACI|nr:MULTISPECIES: YhfH family protein [Halobacillus]MYL21071.1 YhfH family protein [Halobacillus litoralis]MYL31391.1 YhfH family protein [Halobacillus halophilus]